MDYQKNNDLDRIIQQTLASNIDFIVPERLVAEVIRKQEKRMLFRELMLELGFKAGLILGSMGILVGVFAFARNLEIFKRFYDLALDNKELVIIMLSSAVLIVFVDQVILRMYMNRQKAVS